MTTVGGKHLEIFAYDPAEELMSQSKLTFSREAPTDYN